LAVVCFFCLVWRYSFAQSVDETVKDVLLTPREVDGPSFIEELRLFQEKTNITDSHMRTILYDFIQSTTSQAQEDGLKRELTGNAIRLLDYYGDDTSMAVLKPVMKAKNGSLRHRAIETYMRLSDHKITSSIEDVLDNSASYDDLDRRVVYQELTKAYGTVKKKEKRGRLMQTIVRRISNESEKSNFVLLDKFLNKEKEDYPRSNLRKNLLKMHSKVRDGKKNSLDTYIQATMKEEMVE